MDKEKIQQEVLGVLAQIEEVRRQILLLQEQIKEIEASKVTLDSLQEVKEAKELILPIGGGMLIKAKVESPNKVLFNLSGEIFVEITLEEAKKLLEERKEKLTKALESLLKLESELKAKASEMYKSIKEQK